MVGVWGAGLAALLVGSAKVAAGADAHEQARMLRSPARQGPRPGRPAGAALDATAVAVADDSVPIGHLCRGEGLNLVVQPIVDLRTHSVHAYESLLRVGADRSSPGPYFQLAEESGLQADLEYACLVKALELARRRPLGANLMVNVSAETLAQPRVVARLRAHGSLEGIVLEISERSSDEGVDALAGVLAPLAGAGMTLAIDDVGAGPGALRCLTSLSPRYIKLDRSLITGIDKDRARSKLVAALNGYAASIGAWTVAEGIETEAELAELERLGVAYGQGFLLARPADPWPAVAVPEAAPAEPVSLVPPICCVARDETTAQVRDRFMADPALDAVVIIDEDARPLGVLTRQRVTERLGRRLGYELYGERPALIASDQAFLALAPGTDWREMCARAMARSSETRHDPIVLLDAEGRHRDLISIERLLESAPLAAVA
jgi:EAL domain-containing protein (putative c-di-GMP-specific phosphodiesterase class I)